MSGKLEKAKWTGRNDVAGLSRQQLDLAQRGDSGER